MSAAVGVHAFLADAVTRADGKLYAHGAGWNVLGVARLPAVHGHLGLGLIFSVPAAAAAHPHSFEVRLENAAHEPVTLGEAALDGKTLRAVERLAGTLQAGDMPPEARGIPRMVPVALAFSGLRFETAGEHRFVVDIDGGAGCAVEFAVVPFPRLTTSRRTGHRSQ